MGIADGVLVWIFNERVKKGREEAGRLAREMGRVGTGMGITKGVQEGEKDDDVLDDGGEDRVGTSVSVQTVNKKPGIRLRRRVLGAINS